MSRAAPDAARFQELVAALIDLRPDLTPIAAAVLVACDLGIARDSRGFANRLGIPHALALREVGALAGHGLLDVTRRDGRTLRQFYERTQSACRLLDALPRP